ncbi:MAG: UvrD-helicase domain-containing protein [Aureispira sp.]|nr:UvrD-helicase domain-containing protein [Aureispira sp.]
MNLKIISAGAGSGKTYSLTQEMTKLLKPDPKTGEAVVRASGIIATTFTNKAAAELKERVRIKLLEDGLTQEADELGNAMIGTVHAIGVQLLKRFAFEAGVSPEVDIIADGDQQTIFNQSLATVLDLEKVKDMEMLAERLGFQKSPFQRKDWRGDLKQLTDIARANNFGEEILKESQEYSIESYMKLLPAVGKKTAKEFNDELLELLNSTIITLENNEDGTKTKQTLLRSLRSLRTELKNRGYLNWYDWAKLTKLKVSKKSRDDAQELVEFAHEHNKHPDFHKHIKAYITNIFDIAIAALKEYEQYKKTRGLIDYIDMEVLILYLLENPLVLEVLQDDIDLLFVDEFQDTNPLQLKIFLKLTKIAKQAIWVGDPKQSIYGFRGASPELMDAVVKLAEDNNSISVLGNSWRSRQDLVNTVNGLFTRAFDEMPVERVALETAPPFAKKNEDPKLATALHHWHFKFEGNRVPGKPWLENCITRNITKVLQEGWFVREKGSNEVRPLRPGDIAVLCRSNKACQTMAQSLHNDGHKASISRSGLLQTAEAGLILACLKYLLNEYDSLSVAEIMMLAANNDVEKVIENRLDYLNKKEASPDYKYNHKWGESNDYIQKLNLLRSQAQELSATETLNLVIEKLDLRRIIAAWSNEQQRFDNIDALRSLALQYEETCNRLHTAATLGGFLLWMNELAREDLDQQGTGAGSDSVNVLTYHKSKGLEWPLVICHSLDGTLREDLWGIRVINQSEEVNLEDPLANRILCYWINPYSDQIKGTALMDAIEDHPAKEASKKAALAEEARLLYVGLTRARDYLVLPSIPKRATKWLNRVFHKGQENIPTLDTHSSVTPWIWNNAEIGIETTIENYEKSFSWPEQEDNPISYLDAPSGEKAHAPATFEHPRELFPDLKIEVKAPLGFSQTFQLPESEGFDWDYATIAHIFSTFMRADMPTQLSRVVRTKMAQQLLDQYGLSNWIDVQVLLTYSTQFYQRIEADYEIKNLGKNVPFIYKQQQQHFKGMVDFMVETENKELLFIQNASVQTADFFKRRHKIAEEGYYLQAARHALGHRYEHIKSFKHFILFPLEGQLFELNMKQVEQEKGSLFE